MVRHHARFHKDFGEGIGLALEAGGEMAVADHAGECLGVARRYEQFIIAGHNHSGSKRWDELRPRAKRASRQLAEAEVPVPGALARPWRRKTGAATGLGRTGEGARRTQNARDSARALTRRCQMAACAHGVLHVERMIA